MIQHFFNSQADIGAFAAAMGVLTCSFVALGNRRYYVHAPRWVRLGYRVAWFGAAIAWGVRGALIVFGINDGPEAVVPPVAVLVGVLVGLYFLFQMRHFARPTRR